MRSKENDPERVLVRFVVDRHEVLSDVAVAEQDPWAAKWIVVVARLAAGEGL